MRAFNVSSYLLAFSFALNSFGINQNTISKKESSQMLASRFDGIISKYTQAYLQNELRGFSSFCDQMQAPATCSSVNIGSDFVSLPALKKTGPFSVDLISKNKVTVNISLVSEKQLLLEIGRNKTVWTVSDNLDSDFKELEAFISNSITLKQSAFKKILHKFFFTEEIHAISPTTMLTMLTVGVLAIGAFLAYRTSKEIKRTGSVARNQIQSMTTQLKGGMGALDTSALQGQIQGAVTTALSSNSAAIAGAASQVGANAQALSTAQLEALNSDSSSLTKDH